MRPGQSSSPAVRDQWASRAGFVIATLGAAVGLGNIWRFSYVVGENGGGAFLLVYFACVLIVGLPLMLAEFALGRRARADMVTAFRALETSRAWAAAGLVAMLAAFLILSYYAVVAGRTVKYLADYVRGAPIGADAASVQAYFKAFTGDPLQPIAWQAVFLGLSTVVVAAGVERGIERSSRVLMPLLAAIVLALAAYSLTLGAAERGLRFLFAPDWSALSRPGLYLAALGQAFFSLGVGLGVLATYSSYVDTRSRMAPAALAIGLGDTVFAIVAGVAIFPAVFAFGLDPAHGPALAFVTLPEVFARMTGGRAVGVTFFLLLAAAALTSAVSLLEVPVAFLVRRRGWQRSRAAAATGAAAFLAGLPSALSFGVLETVQVSGKGVLEATDWLASNVLLPIGGIAIAVYVGWAWRSEEALAQAGIDDAGLERLWLAAIRVIAPIAILVMLGGMLLA